MQTFHFGAKEVVLFDWWSINSAGAMVASCLGVILLTFVTETFRWLRTCISKQRSMHHHVSKEDVLRLNPSFSGAQILDSLLHLAQIALSSSLMLIIMYQNVWLFLAVIVGEVLSRLIYIILFPNLH